MSAYDYPPPPSDFQALDPRHEPRSRYRYLDSDGTLPRPPVGRYCSEAKVTRKRHDGDDADDDDDDDVGDDDGGGGGGWWW